MPVRGAEARSDSVDVRLPSGAPSGSGIVVGRPAAAQDTPPRADAAAGATVPAGAARREEAPQQVQPAAPRPAVSAPTSTPANSTSGQTPVTGPGGAPRPAAGASLTPRVTPPSIPPAARPDSTSIPPLPSVPDQRTGVVPGQRATALDSARLDRLERQRQQQRDSTQRTP